MGMGMVVAAPITLKLTKRQFSITNLVDDANDHIVKIAKWS